MDEDDSQLNSFFASAPQRSPTIPPLGFDAELDDSFAPPLAAAGAALDEDDDDGPRNNASASGYRPAPITLLDDFEEDEPVAGPSSYAAPAAAAPSSSRLMDEDGEDEDGDEDGDEDDDPRPRQPDSVRPQAGPTATAPDVEEDDEEDESGSEGDEGEGGEGEGRARKRRRKNKRAGNRFLDLEAEADEDEDEDDEDDDDAGREGFIVGRDGAKEPGAPAEEDEDLVEDDGGHRQYDRRKQEDEEKSAQEVAAEIDRREKERRAAARAADQAGAGSLPRNALMPSVDDPGIWGVKVRPGRERELIMSIMRKAIQEDLRIISAFHRESIKGMIYVEANFQEQVLKALAGLIGVFFKNELVLVPLNERADLLRVKRKEVELEVGHWVRFKRGRYLGDLARIEELNDNPELVTVRYIPRIDLRPQDEPLPGADTGEKESKKRKKPNAGLGSASGRPPPGLFNVALVKQRYKDMTFKRVSERDGGGWLWDGDTFRDGFLIKEHKIAHLAVENVNPTIDEVTRFAGSDPTSRGTGNDDDDDGGDVDEDGVRQPRKDRFNLDLVAEAARNVANVLLQPGDRVEVHEGDSKGLLGTVVSIATGVVTLEPEDKALAGTQIEVEVRAVRKLFKIGSHIRVLQGASADETGLVTHVEGDTLVFLSDSTRAPVKVFVKDVREAADVGASSSVVGQYELHDLVQLDPQTCGCIFKIERDAFRVLDQTGAVRAIRPNQISHKLDTRRAIAVDADGQQLAPGDMVKEVVGIGGRDGRTGQVLHVYRSFHAFLHNRDVVENGGVFVAFARYLTSTSPKTNPSQMMNPAVTGGQMAPPPVPILTARGRQRDPIEGLKDVLVTRGPHKGHRGTIKDVNGSIARVELQTTARLVSVDRTKLSKELRAGLAPVAVDEYLRQTGRGAGMAAPAPFGSLDNRAPGQPLSGLDGRTPNPYAMSGAAGGIGGRTPNPYAAANGGITPYAGGRTPGGAGGRTPLGGGMTPYVSPDDHAPTPAVPTPAANRRIGGGSTPLYGGVGANRQTAPTPAAPLYIAASPATGGYYGAPTPGAGSYPTPGYGGALPTPGPSRPRDDYGRPPIQQQQRPAPGYDRPDAHSRFGTATNNAPLGAPSRYGQAAPSPAGAPTPGYGQRYDAPTPWSAPTPGYADHGTPRDAPTPGLYSAATPVNAPSPAPSRGDPSRDYRDGHQQSYYSANTPAASQSFTPGPGQYGAPTPAAYAHTPGPGYGSTSNHAPAPEAAIPDEWPLAGMQVTIVPNPNSIAVFANGRFDQARAQIISVQPAVGPQPLSVRVRLLDSDAHPPNVVVPPVPVQHLEPQHPSRPGQRVVVIGTGQHQHKRALTVSNDASDWLVQLEDGQSLVFADVLLVLVE